MSAAKPSKVRKSRPSRRAEKAKAAFDEERLKRTEAPTMPPPAPGDTASRPSGRVKIRPQEVTVDVVTADLSKDKRHED